MSMRFRTPFIPFISAAIMAGVFFAAPNMPTAGINTAYAATTVKGAPFYYSAWLPFWMGNSGASDIAIHLESLNEVNPFSYEMNNNGTLIDDLKINGGLWDGWFGAVHDMGIKIIPTIAWFDPTGIYNLLSVAKTRQATEDRLLALSKTHDFDGIDIDFEGMVVGTRPYYSLFIKGLAQRLHPLGKKLTCTVVPRPPTDSLAGGGGAPIYAEDYTVLNQYCDEVRLMAYDQGTIDIQLDATKGNGTLYAPVADPAWSEKVIQEALKTISPRKIMLGVPTYGYEYQVSWQGGVTTYERVRSFDYLAAMDRADSLSIEPVRDNADELSFTFASSTHIDVSPVLTATVFSTVPFQLQAPPNPNASTTFFVSFPDAQSTADKIALAKKYNLRGVALFKADGQMDPAIWGMLK